VTRYQLYVELEADSLTQAWGRVLHALPADFGPRAAETSASRGIREFRLEAIDGDGGILQSVEAQFGDPGEETE
jgi:hypothetical protein